MRHLSSPFVGPCLQAMQNRDEQFLEALSEVRVFFGIETIFGIPWLYFIALSVFAIFSIVETGLIFALAINLPFFGILWLFHRDDDRGMEIWIQSLGAKRTWHAGYGSGRRIALQQSQIT